MNTIFKILICFFTLTPVFSYDLQPGFFKEEYIAMIRISAAQTGMQHDSHESDSGAYQMKYRSPEMGLQNQWELWTNLNGIAVISIRGTTQDYFSWVANFYAAMVPAKGSLQLEKNYRFDYHLADDPKAAVHTGWLVGTAMLVRDMLPKLDSLYKHGTKNLVIIGHSQGGAIAYMLTSHLYQLRKESKIPAFVIKTYCSAAPKPGNLYYAYAFEAMTCDGWAYNVVNAADWVPEMPFTVQTASDVNDVNPFVNVDKIIDRQNLVQRYVLRKAYKHMLGPPRRSQEEFERYLGEKIYFLVKQVLPEFEKPKYFNSINYVRTGNTIVLTPDDAYYSLYPDDVKHMFRHHLFEPYLFLINRYDVSLNQ